MKYLKSLLFIFIIFIVPNVFASEFNMNNYTSATQGGTKNRYRATEIYNTGQSGTYTFGTRYNGRISDIETYFDYPFVSNTTYTITYNMNTDDFRNNFGSSYWWDCSQSMTNTNATVVSPSFISMKKVKFTFTTSSDTSCIRVWLRSTSLSSTAITGVSNWRLDNITIYDPDWQGSSNSGQGTVQPTPSTNPNEDIINNNNQNTQDIINNNNQNTQDIIKSQQDLLGSCLKNYITDYTNLLNMTYNNLVFDQITGDTSSNLEMVLQAFNGSSYVKGLSQGTPSGLGYFYLSFVKDNTFNALQFKENGSTRDTGVRFDVSGLEDGKTYYVGANFLNINPQNGFSFSNLMVLDTPIDFFIPFNQTKCTSKIDDTTNAINDVNNSINNSNIDNGVGSDFFNNFSSQDFGLANIITLPLTTIQSLTNTSCVSLSLPIPFTNSSITLPCMTELYNQYIPTIFSIWQIVSFGIIAYFICIDIVHLVKGFKDPDSDKVEVLDL